ncbi:thiamine pyrophosphate-dependent enzyme [bacterium]|nr:thiamine pyrophosphate-dependent enzyme [bacterium]
MNNAAHETRRGIPIPKLSQTDLLMCYEMLSATREFEIALRQNRSACTTPMFMALLQEVAGIAFPFALFKRGGAELLVKSLKNPDHRATYSTAVAMDKLTGAGDAFRLDLARNYFTRAEGGNRGFDGNIHWHSMNSRVLALIASDMGRIPGISAGYAYGIRRNEWSGKEQKDRPIAIAYFGDGAAQNGGLLAAMNGIAARSARRPPAHIEKSKDFLDDPSREAGVYGGIPIIFVVNNNGISCSVDGFDEYGDASLAKRAEGFGWIPYEVSGEDFYEVFKTAYHAIDDAQNLRPAYVVVNTVRGDAHNVDFTIYEDGAIEAGDLSRVKEILGADQEYVVGIRNAWKNHDPLKIFGYQLTRIMRIPEEKLRGIEAAQKKEAHEIIRKVLAEPAVAISENDSRKPCFPSFEIKGEALCETKEKNVKMLGYLEAYTRGVEMTLREGGGCYVGEDVQYGGVLGLTKKLHQKFGPMRVFNTPISEEWIAAFSAGLGLYGTRSFAENQFAHFALDGYALLRLVSTQYFQKGMEFAFTSVLPFGPVGTYGGSGEYHEKDVARFIEPLSGIPIIAPANALDMTRLFKAMISYKGPLALLYQISTANDKEFASLVPENWDDITPFRIGKAEIVRAGADVTVVTYGAACVSAAKNEANALAEEGIGVEVVNLATPYPADFETIAQSGRKTKRLIFLQEDWRGGIADYVISEITTRSPDEGGLGLFLYDRPRIVAAKYPFAPSARVLVWDRLPYERENGNGVHRSARLAAEIRDIMRYS